MRLRNFARNIIRKNYFLHAALLSNGLTFAACQEKEPTESFLLPYEGEIIKDDRGHYFDANAITLSLDPNGNITKKQVENMIKPYNGRIFGWFKYGHGYDIFLPADQRELAIKELPKNPGVIGADRNYYSNSSNYDNDKFTLRDNINTGCSYWASEIELSAGFDLVKNRTFTPTTIAVVEVGGFDINDLQIHYVDKKYHADFSQTDKIIYTVDLDDYTKLSNIWDHGTLVANIAAATNDGKSINGVASINPYNRVLPIKTGSVRFSLDPIKKPQNLLMIDLFEERANAPNITLALEYVLKYADELNIKVVNMSIGGNDQYPLTFSSLIAEFNKRGIIVVASAGNENTTAANHYPSSIEGIISVGATYAEFNDDGSVKKDIRADFSNYSDKSKYVTVSAPGITLLPFRGDPLEKIAKYLLNQEVYGCVKGTSFSSPQVAGLVAVIKSLKPDADYDYVVKLLRAGSDAFFNTQDDKNPETRGMLILRINVRKTLEALLRDIDSPKIGSCTSTKLGNAGFLRSTGKYLIFSEPNGARRILSYSDPDSPLNRTKIPGSETLTNYIPEEILYNSDLLVFGQAGGILSDKIRLFKIGKDTGARSSTLSFPNGTIVLLGNMLEAIPGASLTPTLKILPDVETSDKFTEIQIPNSFDDYGLQKAIIGLDANRTVIGVPQLNNIGYIVGYKYFMYTGNWADISLPDDANCLSLSNHYSNNRLACLRDPVKFNAAVIYDFNSKSYKIVPVDSSSKFTDISLWNDRMVITQKDNSVTVTDLDGKKLFTSPSFSGPYILSTYLQNGRLIYAVDPANDGLGQTLVNCKVE